jgi:hypothetical protein
MTTTITRHPATLSTGEVIEITIGEGTCVKCGERMTLIGEGGEWNHADALVDRPRRHWMGGRFDHDATDDPTAPKLRRRR